ncbi:hypothetical protein K438DRAFT_1648488, partial [Mycena galopus ATCC 62051]
PTPVHYRTDRTLETIRRAKKAVVLFIWVTVSDLLPQISCPNAAYTVAFFSPSSAPFQCVDMSYILLRFMDKYIRGGNYQRFNLVSLSYKLGPTGSFGILVFDNGLRTAYQQARLRARASHNYFRRQFLHPISTWASNSTRLKRSDVVTALMENARWVKMH